MRSPKTAHARVRARIYAATALWIALVGAIDYETPYEINLLMLYLAPVLIVAWHGTRQTAVLVSIYAALTSWVANLHNQPWSLPIYAWRGWNDILCLVLISLGCSATRTRQDLMASRVNDLERARGLEEAIVRISEREQIRIGQDLHDGICQRLTAIKLAMQCLCWEINGVSAPAEKAALAIQEQLEAAARDARDLAHGIFPVQMSPEGFNAAISELVATTNRLRGAPLRLATVGEISVNEPQAALHLYRIVQEAVNNALNHAKASEIEIHMEERLETLTMQIIDNGIGMAVSHDASDGIGLQTMAYRARAAGATFELKQRPGGGTIVSCVYPLWREGKRGAAAGGGPARAAAPPLSPVEPGSPLRAADAAHAES